MDGRVCYGLGYTGHGLGTTRLAGRILAHLALDRPSDLLDLSLVLYLLLFFFAYNHFFFQETPRIITQNFFIIIIFIYILIYI